MFYFVSIGDFPRDPALLSATFCYCSSLPDLAIVSSGVSRVKFFNAQRLKQGVQWCFECYCSHKATMNWKPLKTEQGFSESIDLAYLSSYSCPLFSLNRCNPKVFTKL